jgi:integrase
MNERKLMFSRTRFQNGSLSKVSRKRGPAVWEYRWYDPAATNGSGKRVYRKLIIGTVQEFKTESSAKRQLESMKLNINAPTTRKHPAQMTVSDLIAHYTEKEMGADRHSKTEGTCATYRTFIETWIAPRWGKYRIADVRTAEVEEWLRGSALRAKQDGAKPLANGTKAKIRNIFSALFSHAIRWEFASANPITGPSKGSGVRQSSKRERTPDVFTAAETRSILTELEEPHRTLVMLAASTGFRSSEIRGLKWGDVDFEACTIKLQRSVVGKHVGEMKTASSKRLVPIAKGMAAALRTLRGASAYNQREDWVCASPKAKGRVPIWLGVLMTDHIQPAAKRAGVEKHVTWHGFRHSFSTLLKANGEDIKTVQESLRHATVRITMETYTQAVPEHIRQAQEKIAGQLFASPAADSNGVLIAP